MSRETKVHMIRRERHGNIVTVCGREATLCRGFDPMPGFHGEYDTATCDRINATPYADDVTCGRCKR